MVTGDNIKTAMHIAGECGIYNKDVGFGHAIFLQFLLFYFLTGVAMEGSQFRSMEHEDLLQIIPKLQVLARSQPQDKHLLVSSLQELGDVVAVTGDGLQIY
jgi:Ca2+-transporting ATPase